MTEMFRKYPMILVGDGRTWWTFKETFYQHRTYLLVQMNIEVVDDPVPVHLWFPFKEGRELGGLYVPFPEVGKRFRERGNLKGFSQWR